MREPQRAWLAIPTAWALSLLGSIALAVVSQAIMPGLPPPEFPMKGPIALFMLVVFAPFVETLIMGGLLSLLLRVGQRSGLERGTFEPGAGMGTGDLVAVPDLLVALCCVAPARLLASGCCGHCNPRSAESRAGPNGRLRLILHCAGKGGCPYRPDDNSYPTGSTPSRHRRFPPSNRPAIRRAREVGGRS